jgi:hypothetical protein
MKIGGMGEQAISIQCADLRRLAELPMGVRVVRVLSEPSLVRDDRDWFAGEKGAALYLCIRHRYCFRVPPNAKLCIESFDIFLERFAQLEKREQEIKGERVGADQRYSNWVDDYVEDETP